MQNYRSINDLLVTLYPAGSLNNEAIVKVVTQSNPDPIYFYPDELRPLGEWLIKCADEIGNPGYIAPFPADDEQAECESAADAAQVAFEMAMADDEDSYDWDQDKYNWRGKSVKEFSEHIPFNGLVSESPDDGDNISLEAIGLPEPF